MLSYGLKFTFKAPGKRKPDFQIVVVSSSLKGSNEIPMEGNCALLVSDALLGLEKNKSKKLGNPLQEELVPVCRVLQQTKCLS